MIKGLVVAFALCGVANWYFQMPLSAVYGPFVSMWNLLLDSLGCKLS